MFTQLTAQLISIQRELAMEHHVSVRLLSYGILQAQGARSTVPALPILTEYCKRVQSMCVDVDFWYTIGNLQHQN